MYSANDGNKDQFEANEKPDPGLPGGGTVLTIVKAGINDPGAQPLLNATTRNGLQPWINDDFKLKTWTSITNTYKAQTM